MIDRRALRLIASAVFMAGVAHGDVWEDCTAWYMGGTDKDGDGVFENGELTDIRHAAIADSPTHGGGIRTANPGALNRLETVVSATSGRTFPNQRVIYLSQIPGTASNGNPGVKEEDIRLPFSATTNEYTFLVRLRMDEDQFVQATDKYISVIDLGYKGGSTTKYSFYIRYYPETENFGIVCNNGSTKYNFTSPTNDLCRTLRETWVEMAVSMNKGTMRLGVRAPGMDAFNWNSKTFSFAEGHDVPYNNTIYVGSVCGYGGISSSTYPVRGSAHMMAYWERVLSDEEVEDAFATEGILGSSYVHPTLLSVGSRIYGAEVLVGATTGTVTEVNTDLQDITMFPASIGAGQTVKIPFRVLDTCTNLPQQVRLLSVADSAAGAFAVKVDGVALRPITLLPGKEASRHVKAELFTEGLHTLELTRIDEGANPVRLSMVEISGSWRIGWLDNGDPELGGDITSLAGTKSYYVTGLYSNRWKTVRTGVSQARLAAVYADVTAEDAAVRTFTFKSRPCSYPAQTYDLVLCVNGIERFRRLCLKNDGVVRPSPIEVELPPGTLVAGENEFLWKTEVNPDYPDPTYTWMRLDYYALEVGKDPVGTCLVVR